MLPQSLVEAKLAGRKIFVVTDESIASLYLTNLLSMLSPLSANAPHFILPTGEAEKNLANVSLLLASFQRAGLDRSSVVVALGGGVISDIAGFAASIYMRGISYVSLPTTLLAMADSSIGGKTGIDFNGTKNLVGSFHNPSLVYINYSTLKSLDEEQFISGLAEVIKYGIILDSALFDYICENRAKIASRNTAALEKLIGNSVRLKSKIVAADEKEAGLRQILNYGHTFGHAIESLCGFSLPHGHCVALGMVCATNFSRNMDGMPSLQVKRIHSLLNFFGLPIKLPTSYNINTEDIYNMMLKDKKAKSGALTLIISNKIGTAGIIEKVSKDEVLKAINSII